MEVPGSSHESGHHKHACAENTVAKLQSNIREFGLGCRRDGRDRVGEPVGGLTDDPPVGLHPKYSLRPLRM